MDDMKIDEARRRRLVSVLSSVLERLCERNDRHDQICDGSRFHALRPPGINIRKYLERIARYSGCSEECFVMSLIFIDRFIRASDTAMESFVLSTLNVHRLLITAVMIAAKFFDDHYYNNAYYAKIGGVTRKEMNLLEIDFLFMINFNLSVTPSQYKVYDARLMLHHQALAANATNSISPRSNGSVEEGRGSPTRSKRVVNQANVQSTMEFQNMKGQQRQSPVHRIGHQSPMRDRHGHRMYNEASPQGRAGSWSRQTNGRPIVRSPPGLATTVGAMRRNGGNSNPGMNYTRGGQNINSGIRNVTNTGVRNIIMPGGGVTPRGTQIPVIPGPRRCSPKLDAQQQPLRNSTRSIC